MQTVLWYGKKQTQHHSNDLSIWLHQSRQFSKFRKIRYRRIYGNSARGEPKKQPKTRTKMFVPTHIAHKHDWSPVERIWAQRSSKHDRIDHESLTSLMKETVESIDLLDVIGLTLRKHKRYIEWKPYHSVVALHHLSQIQTQPITCDSDTSSLFTNRYLWDLIEECAMSVSVLKPRFIAQAMWSLNKLGLTKTDRGRLCLLRAAHALNDNPLLHRLEIWNIADAVHVLTANKLFNHPLLERLSQRVIDMHRNNEWYHMNDIAQSYSIMAHSFGNIIRNRNIDNTNGDSDNINYIALSDALLDRFMNDRIYKASNNFEILNFVRGVGEMMTVSQKKLHFGKALKTLESDLYEHMDAMAARDIAVISTALIQCVDLDVLCAQSMWFGNGAMYKYLKNMIEHDAFTLMEMDESMECVKSFMNVLSAFIANETDKENQYGALFVQYIEEVFRFMDLFNERYENATQGDYDYQRNQNVITQFIQIFDVLTRTALKDKYYFLFEQKLSEILCGFLESETRLFSEVTWKRLLSLDSSMCLLRLLLQRKDDIDKLNVNMLNTVFLSMQYHILESEDCKETQQMIENDLNASRHLINSVLDLYGLFYVFQNESVPLISEELRQYLVRILTDEYENKYHLLAQKDRKNVLRALLVLGNEDIDGLVSDFNRFEVYKEVKSALLTQTVNDKTECDGSALAKQIQTDAFQRALKHNDLFIPSAFVRNEENVFQRKNLNEWRFERVKSDKMVQMERRLPDGNVKGPLFEWRAGGIREGAGLHPTLNDVDLEEMEDEDVELDDYKYEDHSLLTNGGDVNYKRIIFRSICDLVLESKSNKEELIGVFVNTKQNETHTQYYKHLSHLFNAKCVFIHDMNQLTNIDSFCDIIFQNDHV